MRPWSLSFCNRCTSARAVVAIHRRRRLGGRRPLFHAIARSHSPECGPPAYPRRVIVFADTALVATIGPMADVHSRLPAARAALLDAEASAATSVGARTMLYHRGRSEHVERDIGRVVEEGTSNAAPAGDNLMSTARRHRRRRHPASHCGTSVYYPIEERRRRLRLAPRYERCVVADEDPRRQSPHHDSSRSYRVATAAGATTAPSPTSSPARTRRRSTSCTRDIHRCVRDAVIMGTADAGRDTVRASRIFRLRGDLLRTRRLINRVR